MVTTQSLALSRAYRVNLNMLALISLLTGAVLVFSAQSARTFAASHFALLRALGLTQPQLKAVTRRGRSLGVVGAVLGVGLGLAVAAIALLHAGTDLGAGYFRYRSGLHIDLLGVSLIAATGIGACVLGGAIPAWDAASAPPARALRAGDEQHLFAKTPRPLPGLTLLATGCGMLALPAIGDLPVFGYAAIGCFLAGALLLMPWYARHALHAAPLPRHPCARLAIDQLREASGFAGDSLATMLTSISLAVAMLIMIHSFRHSLDAWLSTILPADLYVRAGAESSAWLDPAAQERIQSAPAVTRVVFSRHISLLLDPLRPLVTLIARDLDPNNPEAVPLLAPQQLPQDGTIPAWISEAMRDSYAAQLGERIRLPIGDAIVEVTVAGVWRDYARQGGAVLISRSDYVRVSADRLVNDAWLWIKPGQQAAQVAQALRDRLGVGAELEIREPGTLRALSLRSSIRHLR
jgi:putative ABC transport system permease protein